MNVGTLGTESVSNGSRQWLLAQVFQALLHKGAICVLIKQAAKLFPGVPFQVKIHIPLQGQGVGRRKLVHLPAIGNGRLRVVLRLIDNGRIRFGQQFSLQVLLAALFL